MGFIGADMRYYGYLSHAIEATLLQPSSFRLWQQKNLKQSKVAYNKRLQFDSKLCRIFAKTRKKSL